MGSSVVIPLAWTPRVRAKEGGDRKWEALGIEAKREEDSGQG